MSSHGIPRVTAGEKSEETKQKEQQKIAQYRDLADRVNSLVKEKQLSLETFALTSKLLTQNPEYYTIWNHRRLILEHQFKYPDSPSEPTDDLSAEQVTIRVLIINDLQFLIPLMRKFPKCYWMWNHRLWLLEQTIKEFPVKIARKFWQDELGLASHMLGKDSRNFHGWDYRRHLVSRLESADLAEDGQVQSMVEEEFAYTTKMIRSNLSNFSAWHYRGKLNPRLLNQRQASKEDRRKFLDAEFELIQQALYTDPGDQSLWKYHQYLLWNLAPTTKNSSVIITDLTNHDRLELYEREINNIKEMIDPDEECKWIYQALLQYSSEYLEFDAGTKLVTTAEMREWLEDLRKLDPIRKGRWDDLEKKLNL